MKTHAEVNVSNLQSRKVGKKRKRNISIKSVLNKNTNTKIITYMRCSDNCTAVHHSGVSLTYKTHTPYLAKLLHNRSTDTNDTVL